MSLKRYIIVRGYADADIVVGHLINKYKYVSCVSASVYIKHVFEVSETNKIVLYTWSRIRSICFKLIGCDLWVIKDIPVRPSSLVSSFEVYYKRKIYSPINCIEKGSKSLETIDIIAKTIPTRNLSEFLFFKNKPGTWSYYFNTKKKLTWTKSTNKYFEKETKESIAAFFMITKTRRLLPKDVIFLIISEIANLSQPDVTVQTLGIKKDKIKLKGASINIPFANMVCDYVIKNCVRDL